MSVIEERIDIKDALLSKGWEFNEDLYKKVQNDITKQEYTYKELCEVLEQERYGGNQKVAQIKEFNRYMECEYDKEKKKFIIGKKYDTPLPSLSSLPANTLYAQHIKIILLSYLLRHENSNPDGAIYISSQNLYKALGLVNRQYIEYLRKDKKKELRAGLLNELKTQSLKENRIYTIDGIGICNTNQLANSCKSYSLIGNNNTHTHICSKKDTYIYNKKTEVFYPIYGYIRYIRHKYAIYIKYR